MAGEVLPWIESMFLCSFRCVLCLNIPAYKNSPILVEMVRINPNTNIDAHLYVFMQDLMT